MQTLKYLSEGRWLAFLAALSTTLNGMAQTTNVSASAPSFASSTASAATPAPPPSSPAKRSPADLEKLVAPIALYPDPLLATVLPASVYPLEIVQAARFVADTNNLAKLDAQPWDDNVKNLARVPDALKKMNEDLNWTIELGEAFLAQDKDVMDAIQRMRTKAQQAGTLRTSEQQTVIVTNMVVETKVEQQTVVVTNTVVQIQPASTTTVYVPTYNPYTVYYPPPGYVYNPYAPLVSFGIAVGIGAIIHNNCDWHHGGCYNGDVNVDIDRNVNRERNVDRDGSRGNRAGQTGAQKKWQPDQSRLNKSGAPSATTRDSRGWGGGSTQAGQRPASPSAGARPTSSFGNQAGASPAQRAGGQAGGARPTTTWQQPSGSRPSSGVGGSQSGARQPSAGSRPSSPASRPSASPSVSRPSSGSSAFSGVNSGSSARSASSRGSASRGGGGGGARGGGGRGR